MENLKPFSPRDLFAGKDRIIIKGGFDPWTMNGRTKLEPGAPIDVPLSIYGIQIPLVGIFDIARIERVKLAELSDVHTAGNIPEPKIHLSYGDKGAGEDAIIVHVDPDSLRIRQAYYPKNRRKADGSTGLSMI